MSSRLYTHGWGEKNSCLQPPLGLIRTAALLIIILWSPPTMVIIIIVVIIISRAAQWSMGGKRLYYHYTVYYTWYNTPDSALLRRICAKQDRTIDDTHNTYTNAYIQWRRIYLRTAPNRPRRECRTCHRYRRQTRTRKTMKKITARDNEYTIYHEYGW
jgi:hypothetical protein